MPNYTKTNAVGAVLRTCGIPAIILAAFVCWIVEAGIFGARRAEDIYAVVEWTMKAQTAGTATFSYEEGNTPQSRLVSIKPDENQIAKVSMLIPRSGRYRSFSIALLDRPSAILFDGITVRSLTGSFERKIPASEFTSASPMQKMGTALAFAGATPPTVSVKFDPYLHVSEPWSPHWPSLLALFAGSSALFAAVIRWVPWKILVERCRANPRRTVFLAALLGVTLSCYPILFCGMSWVSPSAGVPMIYRQMPTIPVDVVEPNENPVGSDAGATLTCHWPMVFHAHRAVFQDGEMPLWNRYSWCGISQVGQFFHMWGDPLHWLPIASGGASWAWDVKGLLTRLIYAFGCGLLVWRTCSSLRVALVLTVSACFHGFFLFRTAHVAVFAFAYMPWVLLGWVEAARAETIRGAIRWAALMAFASWQGLNGGTAKEATLSIAAMNCVGVATLLGSAGTWRLRLGKLAWMCWANVLLLLLSAPLWMHLLDSLRNGFCLYQIVKVHQLQPGLALGLFDEIFQRQVRQSEFVVSCGANFLILLGALWSLTSLRKLRSAPIFLASAACVLIAAALTFGAVPASLLAKIPILQTIYHFDVTFSFLLFTPLLVIAGLGLREMWDTAEDADWKWNYAAAALVFIALWGAFLGYTEASHREGLSVHPVGTQYYKSAFFLKYAAGISLSLLALPWLCRTIRPRHSWAPTATVLAVLAFIAIHFRMGMHLETSFDHYTYNPKSRFDYRTMNSPGLNFVKAATQKEPWRVYGLNGTLVPGFSIIPGVETLCGAEAFETRGLGELISALNLERTNWNWRLSATTYSYAAKQRALDFLGVRYLLSEKGDPMPDGKILPLIHQSDLQVGESKSAWPRAFFTDAAMPAASMDAVSGLVATGDGRPFAAVEPAILKAHASLIKDPASRVAAAATNYRLTNNSTAFDIAATAPGLAVLHETIVPGDIVATVDEKEVPCLTVNGAFRGVWVDAPGTHTVKFTYAPRVWTRSLRVAAGGIILVLLTMIAVRRTRPSISQNAAL